MDVEAMLTENEKYSVFTAKSIIQGPGILR